MTEQPTNDISNLSLIELKALAFDQISLLTVTQKNLEVINKQMHLLVSQAAEKQSITE